MSHSMVIENICVFILTDERDKIDYAFQYELLISFDLSFNQSKPSKKSR